MKWLRRAGWAAVLLGALAYLGGVAYLYFRQGTIIYLPTREVSNTPRDYGIAHEQLRLPVKRRGGATESISAWWLPAPAPNGMAILFLHGNARNMGARGNAEKVAALAKAGFNLLTIDYRGYGQSDGAFPDEASLYEDARAALDELARRAPDPGRRILHGHSLGGAVAIELALRRPEFAAAFIEASFTSMLDMSTRNRLFRLLPIDTLLTERFDSAAKIGGLRLPVLFIHGTRDERVPHTMSMALFARAPEPKALILVENGAHSNLHDSPQYAQAYRTLLDMAKK